MRERIVVMTGDLVNKETKEFLAEVGVPTIAKPLDIRQVVRTVTEILQRVGSP